MIHLSFKLLEVIIYIPNASFTHNIDCCSQNEPKKDMQDLAKVLLFNFHHISMLMKLFLVIDANLLSGLNS